MNYPQGERPANAYQLLDQMAERTPAGSGKLIFTPWLYGERTPVEDHLVRGGFYNLSLSTTRADMVRAVFEGVAYNARWLLKYVELFNKRPVEALNIVGGGAKSNIWCQIHADVLDRPIRQVKDPIEANVRGAALLASAGLGYLKYDEIGTHVKIANTYMPNPDNRKIYDELFQEFLAIYESNKKIYARLNIERINQLFRRSFMSLKDRFINMLGKLNPRFLAFAEKQMKNIPGVSQKLEGEYAEIMVELERSVKPYKNKFDSFKQIPAVGRDHVDILRDMEAMRRRKNPTGGMVIFQARSITATRNTLIF